MFFKPCFSKFSSEEDKNPFEKTNPPQLLVAAGFFIKT